MDDRDVLLNHLAQNAMPQLAGAAWFDQASPEDRSDALRRLALFCSQAHPTLAEVELAVGRTGLKRTHTPCVMLLSAQSLGHHSFLRVAELPASEHSKGFALLLSVLAVADARRRQQHCADGCTHDWHNMPQLPQDAA
jgi:hypothetical protein